MTTARDIVSIRLWAPALLTALLMPGPGVVLADNQRPTVQFTTAPDPLSTVFYLQHFSWLGSDPDGMVVAYRWAIDPVAPDTFWNVTPDTARTLFFSASTPETPYPAPGTPMLCHDLHTVVLESVDDLGLTSAPEARTFDTRNQAPSVQIVTPTPSPTLSAQVTSSPWIDWTGTDADGVFTTRPVRYRYHLASRQMVQQALGISTTPTATQLQQYFSLEAPGFASWNLASADSSEARYTNLTLSTTYYFGVTAFDEAGGWEPRFSRSINVLAMVVTSIADVAGNDAARELRVSSPRPNPARGDVAFDLVMPQAGSVSLDVFDTAGRRIRRLVAERWSAGSHSASWDLRDEAGAVVRPGAYLARFKVDGNVRVRRFVVMR